MKYGNSALGTVRFLLAVTLLSIILAGCGGGGGSSTTTVVDPGLFTPNYISSLDPGLLHWNHLPVKFRFVLPTDWNTVYALHPDLNLDAMNEWNQPGLQSLTTVVASGEDVLVTFVPQSTLPSPTAQAVTSYSYYTGSYEMKTASIQVALDYPGGILSAAAAQAVIAHEAGHAIGIGGHSPTGTDIMYPVLSLISPQSVTLRDMNTIKCAYPTYYATTGIQPFRATPPAGELRHAVIE